MSRSPIPKIRFPREPQEPQVPRKPQEVQDQNAQPTQLPTQQPTRQPENEEWARRHEAYVQSTLNAHRRRIRNGLLLTLVPAIAGLAALTASMKPTNPAYEESHDEVEPGEKAVKKEGNPKPLIFFGQSTKPQKIEIHRDIPREFFVIAEKMINRGSLRSRHLEASKRASWATSIVEQMSRADIPLNRQNLMIVLATIDHESGFHETGIIHAPESILDRKIEEFKKENPHVYSLMEDRVTRLRAQALQFINARRADNAKKSGQKRGYFTERDVNLAVDYAMKLYESEAPDVVKEIIPKESLNKYRPRTSGCMQINVKKAINLAKEVDGETYTDREMRKRLDTKKGGLYYGMLYLKKIIDAHTSHYGEHMSADEVRYVFADYNMGVHTTRNAAIQSNVRALGKDIAVDGDLMLYNEQGEVSGVRSDTEKAIRDVLREAGEDISGLEIRNDLLLEKRMDFKDTRTYHLLKKIFKKHGLTKTHVIPSMKTSGSFVKFGTTRLSGAGYAERSYRRYEALKNTHKAPKAKRTKSKK